MSMILKLESMIKPNDSFEITDKQDLTIETTKTYAEVLAEVEEKYKDAVITPVSIYQPDNSEVKNITFHLEFH